MVKEQRYGLTLPTTMTIQSVTHNTVPEIQPFMNILIVEMQQLATRVLKSEG